MTQNKSNGLRFNNGKPRMDLVSWPAVTELAKVLAAGAQKYEARNWEKGLSYSDTFASLQRHITAWYNGEENDTETGLPHLAHVMCNAMFLQHFAITNTGTDDRPKNNKPDKGNPVKEKDFDTSYGVASLARAKEEYVWQQLTGRSYHTNETIGSRVEQGYSGFLSEGNQDTVVERGLPDVQAYLRPSANTRVFNDSGNGYGRMEGYSGTYSDSERYPTECWTVREREEAPSNIPSVTQGYGGRTVPMADGYGYGESPWVAKSSELRFHDYLGASEALYVGDGCADVRFRCGGEPST